MILTHVVIDAIVPPLSSKRPRRARRKKAQQRAKPSGCKSGRHLATIGSCLRNPPGFTLGQWGPTALVLRFATRSVLFLGSSAPLF